MDSPVFTIRDVAGYLKCHQSTIYRLLKARQLRGFKLGADWRFLQTDIDAFIANAQRGSGNGTNNGAGSGND